jgi:hypothetical protein
MSILRHRDLARRHSRRASFPGTRLHDARPETAFAALVASLAAVAAAVNRAAGVGTSVETGAGAGNAPLQCAAR